MKEVGYAATPHADLIAQIMDSRLPKNEREHAAARELASLQTQLSELREQRDESDHQCFVAKKQLAEAGRDLARWAKLRPLVQQISDCELREIMVSFLDRFAYGESKFDMQAGLNAATRATDSATGVQQ